MAALAAADAADADLPAPPLRAEPPPPSTSAKSATLSLQLLAELLSAKLAGMEAAIRTFEAGGHLSAGNFQFFFQNSVDFE